MKDKFKKPSASKHNSSRQVDNTKSSQPDRFRAISYRVKNGVVIRKFDKWLKVSVNGHEDGPDNYMLINEHTENLSAGDAFSVYAKSICKRDKDGKMQWFHIPLQKCVRKHPIIIGFGVDNMIVQPCVGNIFVKGDRCLRIAKVTQKNNGWSYNYTSELWWELYCEDITDTPKGQEALKQQLNRLEL